MTAGAQMAQQPLLSSASPVTPNIMFMLDDSSSMPADAIYQYGGSESVYGMTGPGGCSGLTTNQYASKSPDVNLLYYDPRLSYKRPVQADGTPMAAGNAAAVTSFNVYFYGAPPLYRVASVTLDSCWVYDSPIT